MPAAQATSPRSPGRIRRLLLWGPILILTLGWAALYLPHLRTNPGWYGDETSVLLIGQNLLRGESAIGAIRITHWHTYYPMQPVYELVVGMFSFLTGGDILGARFSNALIALAISLAIFVLGRSRLGILPAFFGASLLLTFQQSIIHYRWTFPHNAVGLGFALTVLYLLRPSSPRTDWKAGGGLALAALSHPLFVHGAVAAFLCRLKRPAAWIRMALPPALALALVWLAITIQYWPKPWLVEDLGHLARYYSDDSGRQLGFLANAWNFFRQDAFHTGTLIAIFLCATRRFYPIGLTAVVLSSLLLNNRQNLPVFYYQTMIVVPVFCLAWAGALAVLTRRLRRLHVTPPIRRLVRAAPLALPGIYFLTALPAVWSGGLVPRNQYWVTQNMEEVEAAARWLNEHTTAGDLVIANWNIAWLLKARTADFLQATVWEGLTTEYLPEPVSRDRFRYPAGLAEAKYVVIGDIDQRYVLRLPNIVPNAIRQGLENWPVVWAGPNYSIMKNPNPSSTSPP